MAKQRGQIIGFVVPRGCSGRFPVSTPIIANGVKFLAKRRPHGVPHNRMSDSVMNQNDCSRSVAATRRSKSCRFRRRRKSLEGPQVCHSGAAVLPPGSTVKLLRVQRVQPGTADASATSARIGRARGPVKHSRNAGESTPARLQTVQPVCAT